MSLTTNTHSEAPRSSRGSSPSSKPTISSPNRLEFRLTKSCSTIGNPPSILGSTACCSSFPMIWYGVHELVIGKILVEMLNFFYFISSAFENCGFNCDLIRFAWKMLRLEASEKFVVLFNRFDNCGCYIAPSLVSQKVFMWTYPRRLFTLETGIRFLKDQAFMFLRVFKILSMTYVFRYVKSSLWQRTTCLLITFLNFRILIREFL